MHLVFLGSTWILHSVGLAFLRPLMKVVEYQIVEMGVLERIFSLSGKIGQVVQIETVDFQCPHLHIYPAQEEQALGDFAGHKHVFNT